MSAIDSEPFPRPALICAGVLLTLSLAAAAGGRLLHATGAPPEPATASADVLAAQLRFADGPDGSVRVSDAGDGRIVSTVKPGEGGFVRGVIRGLAHDRMRRKITSGPPFRLTLAKGGALRLTDEATGREIDLNAFGADNRQAFVDLLQADRGRS